MSLNCESPAIPARNADGISRQALQFFALAIVAMGFAAILFGLLCRFLGKPHIEEQVLFPPAFAVSSALLVLGSFSLHRAVVFVRVEKQRQFRFWLIVSLFLGSLFMGVQSYALWLIFPTERAYETATLGVSAFVLCLTTLHGLHFGVAVLFVAFTISRARANRYDHEYHWGVQACAWFWHFLVVVWVAIMAVIAIAL